jgi:hypothetical protein
MPTDLNKLAVRVAYLKTIIDRFLLTDGGNYILPVLAADNAAKAIAGVSFDIEDSYIRPEVSHAQGANELLCRHKIIAATQFAIMRLLPLRFEKVWGYEIDQELYRVNARLAIQVSILMLKSWLTSKGIAAATELRRPEFRPLYNTQEKFLAQSFKNYQEDNFPYIPTSLFWATLELAAKEIQL